MIFQFANCSIDTTHHVFRRDGAPHHLEPQVFDLLAYFAQNPDVLVTKDALVAQIWGGLAVSDATISARIHAARAAVGDSGSKQQVIQTVARRGFRLVVPVTRDAAPASGNDDRQDIRFATGPSGIQIAYATSGSGPPLLRASHWLSHLQLDWDSPVWRPLLDALGRDHTVIRYDQRGTGLSDRTVVGQDLGDFVEDLKAVADALGLDRFPIFAASQAVPAALRFAAENPQRVSKLVLYGGFAQGRSLRSNAPGDADEQTMLALIRAGWGQHDSAFAKAFSALFMPGGTRTQIDSFIRMQQQSIAPEGAVRLRQIVDRFDVLDLLDQIEAPTLVIHTRADAIHPIEQGRLLASHIEDARFVMLDTSNHILLPQDPAWKIAIHETGRFLADG
jgi:pimeloyl-ACP methyl ester carboxylesterase